MIVIWEYVDREGLCPYARWFNRLNAQTAAKVATALVRLGQGNLSGVKGVDGGVFEHRIDFGPGYRIYFGKDGDALVILLAGGKKRRQRQDVETVRASWSDHKRRKRQEG